MKANVILFSIAQCLMFTSCFSAHPKIKGSGNVVSETREVSAFDKIKIDGVVNVILVPGSTENVVVETDSELQPYIHVYNNGRTLVIDTDPDKDLKFTKNNVYVAFEQLHQIMHHGVGSIKSEGKLVTTDLFIENKGVGNAELSVLCENLEIRQTGVGSLDIEGFTTTLILKNTGVGSVNAYHLDSEYAEIENKGVGSVSVLAQKEISIHSSGVGSVKYHGNAQVTSLHASGVGSVKKTN
jgi:hypothetical protein